MLPLPGGPGAAFAFGARPAGLQQPFFYPTAVPQPVPGGDAARRSSGRPGSRSSGGGGGGAGPAPKKHCNCKNSRCLKL